MYIVFTESTEGEFRLFYVDRALVWLHAHGIEITRDRVKQGESAEPTISIAVSRRVSTSVLKEAVEVGCNPNNAWWKHRVKKYGFFFTEPQRQKRSKR